MSPLHYEHSVSTLIVNELVGRYVKKRVAVFGVRIYELKSIQ